MRGSKNQGSYPALNPLTPTLSRWERVFFNNLLPHFSVPFWGLASPYFGFPVVPVSPRGFYFQS